MEGWKQEIVVEQELDLDITVYDPGERSRGDVPSKCGGATSGRKKIGMGELR